MPTEVIMPALGVAQQTGTLLKWLKKEGQTVSRGEPLMEIETDKATIEMEAPASGTLSQVTAQAGDEIPVGQRIALILGPGERPQTRPDVAGPAAAKPETGAATDKLSVLPVSQAPASDAILASPAAKRLARERGIVLASLRGSGPHGSILAADVSEAGRANRGDGDAAEKLLSLNPMRRNIGARMTQSKQTAPHFYLNSEIDMDAVNRVRSDWKSRGDPSVPSINDFVLFACARALKDSPMMNASYESRGIKLSSEIHIGMAVALDDGLVVPVIRHADRLSLKELAIRSHQLVEKAQNKKLVPRDCEGGTFTVSNLGMLGIDSFTAIINPPQCAILAVGRMAEQVVAEEGMFAIKLRMSATLSADHRVVDGAIAARFLLRIKHDLEKGQFSAPG